MCNLECETKSVSYTDTYIRLKSRLHCFRLHTQAIPRLQAYNNRLPHFAPFLWLCWLFSYIACNCINSENIEPIIVHFDGTHIQSVVGCAVCVNTRNVCNIYGIINDYCVVYIVGKCALHSYCVHSYSLYGVRMYHLRPFTLVCASMASVPAQKCKYGNRNKQYILPSLTHRLCCCIAAAVRSPTLCMCMAVVA